MSDILSQKNARILALQVMVADRDAQIERLTRERDEANEYFRQCREKLEMYRVAPCDEAAERKVEKLREALNFYARHSTYRTCTIYMSGAREETNAERDCGEIARAALAETEKGDE